MGLMLWNSIWKFILTVIWAGIVSIFSILFVIMVATVFLCIIDQVILYRKGYRKGGKK